MKFLSKLFNRKSVSCEESAAQPCEEVKLIWSTIGQIKVDILSLKAEMKKVHDWSEDVVVKQQRMSEALRAMDGAMEGAVSNHIVEKNKKKK